ncbi:MAG: putative prolyl oligopeptidase family protein [Nevskia sp.]|nr:putative prolyl oligopeptidase family protein [Nevskia sp.]
MKVGLGQVIRDVLAPKTTRGVLAGISRLMPGWTVAFVLAIGVCIVSRDAYAESAKSARFTVDDDIALSEFTDPLFGLANIKWSPNGRYIAVVTQRGILKQNVVKAELRVFSIDAVRNYVDGHGSPELSEGHVLATMTSNAGRAVISDLRWLPDSSGIAFLANTVDGRRTLFEASLGGDVVTPLSAVDQIVTAYDFNNGHFAYTAVKPGNVLDDKKSEAVTTIGTGKDLGQLIGPPHDPLELPGLSELWIADDGMPRQLKDAEGNPIRVAEGSGSVAPFRISPDGVNVVAQLIVSTVPKSWERYRPGDDFPNRRITAKEQDQDALGIGPLFDAIKTFTIINVKTGNLHSISGPIGWQDSYYMSVPDAEWSPDGRYVVLSNAFLDVSQTSDSTNPRLDAPCIATVDVRTGTASCVMQLPHSKAEMIAKGIGYVEAKKFGDGGDQEVVIEEEPYSWGDSKTLLFRKDTNDEWHAQGRADATKGAEAGVRIYIKQGLNDRPVLVAEDRGGGHSKVIFDPNPQLEKISLGIASVFQWSDEFGRGWTGGLVKPPDYIPGHRYPLVIQTHGFLKDRFLTSGAFTSGMAARELAAGGIIVLQLGDPDDHVVKNAQVGTPEEGRMYLAGYQGAIKALSDEGLVDPNKVGLVGFSRTVYHVMNAITTSDIRFAAASIVDGMNLGYLQELESASAGEAPTMIGAPPFGDGLKLWRERSPEFNLDRVQTPLRVEAFGRNGLFEMWEPYAGLHYLKRPVDLVMLNSSEHVITNPAVRLASQGGMADWMRFWLEGYEDPALAKAEQYKRWEGLRETQNAQTGVTPAAR